MWITLDTQGHYLPIKTILTQHGIEYIHVRDSVLAIMDTPRSRRITTFIALAYPCSVQESTALATILLEYQTCNPKRVTKMS